MSTDTLQISLLDRLATTIIDFLDNLWEAFKLFVLKATSLNPDQLMPVYYVLTTILMVWVLMSIYSIHRWSKWKDRIKLGRFTSSGDLAEKVGDEELRLMLRAQLEEITSTYARERCGVASFYTASAVGDRFRGLNTALTCAWRKISPPEIADLNEFKIKLWNVEIPIARFIRSIFMLLRIGLPVPKNDQYLNSIVHGSMTVVKEQAVLVVYKGAPPAGRARVPEAEIDFGERPGASFFSTRAGTAAKRAWSSVSKARDRSAATALSASAVVKTATDLEQLMRRGAFMVLELSGATATVGNAESVRHLADGLNILDLYTETGDDQLLFRAEKHFEEAAHADHSNHLASYFYATLLLNERSRKSIGLARQFFTRAAATEHPMLRALIQTGLANCHLQSYHRLAVPPEDAIANAKACLDEAIRSWSRSPAQGNVKDAEHLPKYLRYPKIHPHPWIVATQILLKHVQAGDSGTVERNLETYEEAVLDYLDAMKNEPENCNLPNNLGWLLLKLADGGLKRIESDVDFPERIKEKRLEEISEHYLLQALDLKPGNKLTHANLSLLYATPFFREKEGTNYLENCKFYGKRAIEIDPTYVNGHRDLAIALIRYGAFEDAYFYYLKALRLADVITKDHEIMRDARKALNEREDVTQEIQELFEHPPAELLEPPTTVRINRRTEQEKRNKDGEYQKREVDQKKRNAEIDEAAEPDAQLRNMVRKVWEGIRRTSAIPHVGQPVPTGADSTDLTQSRGSESLSR